MKNILSIEMCLLNKFNERPVYQQHFNHLRVLIKTLIEFPKPD